MKDCDDGVVAAGPGLVAIGRSGVGDDTDAAVWTSTDGISWARISDQRAFGGPGRQVMLVVAAMEGGFHFAAPARSAPWHEAQLA